MDDDIQLYKIVLIGNSATGKTNLSTRYIKGEFCDSQQASVGAEFYSKTMNVKGKNVKITLWDTAGQERFKSLSKVYYKGARGVLVVYDITEPKSYVDIEEWLRLANETVNLSDITVFVVGNKADLEKDRKVTYDRAVKEYKQEFDVDCWEVSAKTGFHIEEMFTSMFNQIHQKGIDIKNSLCFGSELATYSEIERDSVAQSKRRFSKQMQKEMKPIGEVIIEEKEREEGLSNIIRTNDIPWKMVCEQDPVSRLSLANDDQIELKQVGKKKRKCCHH